MNSPFVCRILLRMRQKSKKKPSQAFFFGMMCTSSQKACAQVISWNMEKETNMKCNMRWSKATRNANCIRKKRLCVITLSSVILTTSKINPNPKHENAFQRSLKFVASEIYKVLQFMQVDFMWYDKRPTQKVYLNQIFT